MDSLKLRVNDKGGVVENPFGFPPIGFAKSWFTVKNGTPRQGGLSNLSRGSVQIQDSVFNNPEHSLDGLQEFSHVWIIWVFSENKGHYTKAKIAPPRLGGKRVGVFSTRTPHRPNPIGLTLAKLEKIEGATIHLSGIDLLDGTPILDIKPFIPEYDTAEGLLNREKSNTRPTQPSIALESSDSASSSNSYNGNLEQTISGTRERDIQLLEGQGGRKVDKEGKCADADILQGFSTGSCEHPTLLDPLKDSLPIEHVCLKKAEEKQHFKQSRNNLSESREEHWEGTDEANPLKRVTLNSSVGSPNGTFHRNMETSTTPFKSENSQSRSNSIASSRQGHGDTDNGIRLLAQDEAKRVANSTVTDSDPTVISGYADTDRGIGLEVQTGLGKITEDSSIESNANCSDQPPLLHQGTATQDPIKIADWLRAKNETRLKVRFTPTALEHLNTFSDSSCNEHFRFQFLKDSEAQKAIADILQEDPRSIYRKKKCVDKLYFVMIDAMHVTAWYDDESDVFEVVRVMPKSLRNKT